MKHVLKKRGFSLIELLVVVSIFTIITSVVIFNQNKFSSDISISNSAYAVAIQIHQAQVFGTLVRNNNQEFDAAYGIHLVKDDAGKITLLTFADLKDISLGAPNLQYDVGEPILNSKQLGEGNSITDVCVYDTPDPDASVPATCFSGGNIINNVDIVFKRPDPDAVINPYYAASPSIPFSGAITKKGQVNIQITSSLGDKVRTVKVTGTGQISVQ